MMLNINGSILLKKSALVTMVAKVGGWPRWLPLKSVAHKPGKKRPKAYVRSRASLGEG